MTNKTKDQIKAFFESGDRPTQAHFIDFIDSYVDKSGPIGEIETAASGGTSGFPYCSAGNGEILNAANSITKLGISVYTTAQVTSIVGNSYTTTAAASSIATSIITNSYATTAQATAGTTATGIMSPILVKQAVNDLISSYSGTQATIAALTDYSFTHSLGAVPDIVSITLVCGTTDAGYAVGDEVIVDSIHTGVDSSLNARGATVAINSTDINVSFTNGYGLFNKTTGGFVSITFANWSMKVKAYKFN